MNNKINISVTIPVYNEERNVKILYERLKKVLSKLNKTYEIIFIDDGSLDKTYDELLKINDKHLKIVKFRKRFGQTAATDAGFKAAKGSVIISMDGDLQNDPRDIPLLLNKLNQDYDVVCGWRFNRKDHFLKKLFSKSANLMRRKLTKDELHDSGCSFRVYKKECFDNLDLYGEMHRYIPTLLLWKGFKVGEVKVNHNKRANGKTKYGPARIFKGFLDLFMVLFWRQYSGRPIHLFGGLGLILIIIGTAITVPLVISRILGKISLTDRPLFLLGILIIIMGIQFFISGVLADIAIKSYYKQTNNSNYLIEKVIKK